MRRTPTRLLTALIASAALASTAACGSSGPSASPSTTAQTPTQHLAAMVLQPSDLPRSWTSTPHPASSTASDAATMRSLGACVGQKTSYGQSLLGVHSRDYAQGPFHARSDVTSYRTQAAVQSDLKILSAKKINTCYAAVARKAASAQAGSAKFTELKFSVKAGRHGGPVNVAALITSVIGLKQGKRSVTVYGYSWAISGPKLEATVSFDGVDKKVPSEFQLRLVRAVAARVAKG